MRTRIVAAGLVAMALALTGCKGEKHDGGGAEPGPAASGPPPVVIANSMGACDDVPACTRACNEQNDAESCRKLAVTYEFGKSDAGRNETTGTTFFDRSCALGSAPGCVSAGQMHEYAHGVPQDFKLAADSYARSCTLGWQAGCANWAIMLEKGRGVGQDLARAKQLFDSACKAGSGLACEHAKAIAGVDAGR